MAVSAQKIQPHPQQLAESEELRQLMEVMGLHIIPADEVRLTTRLLRKK